MMNQVKSHLYQVQGADWLRALGPPLGAIGLLAVFLHAGAALGIFPRPRPALDIDRTILVHQADASRMSQPASLVLLGDSSCMMDVNAAALQSLTGQPALNLGTLSYLDLDSYTLLLRQYIENHPRALKTVVLLLHPMALRLAEPHTDHAQFLRDYLEGIDSSPGSAWNSRFQWVLGLDKLRNRILARCLPTPLPGSFGQYYGFTTGLERCLSEKQGGAVDPNHLPPRGNPEFQINPRWEKLCRRFRKALPSGVTLAVGITPVPANFPGSDYPLVHKKMLATLADWLRADATLDGLPATLPADRFAGTTHLNGSGAREYTRLLGQALERIPSRPAAARPPP
jgi:hypothetical protein